MTATSSRLCLTYARARGYTVVIAAGALDAGTVVQLRSMLLQTLVRDGPYAVLDLAAVTDIDASGVDALRRTGDRAVMLGGDFRLAAAHPALARTLHQTRLDRVLGVYNSLTAATRGAHHRPPPAPPTAALTVAPGTDEDRDAGAS